MASTLARDELQLLSAAAVAATLTTKKKKRRIWTKDWLLNRGSMFHLQLLEELKE